jgi:hypothetical protein
VGAAGIEFTVRAYVATPAEQGDPNGLFVVAVIVTILPPSVTAGVYVNEKGDTIDDDGLNIPAPFDVNVTSVAVPPKVLPVTVTAAIPQVLPFVLLRATIGGLLHPHETEKRLPVVVHPAVFLTEK